MTEADYIATPARTGKPFTFTRIRAGAANQAFLPGEGSRLHFANRAVDTLEVTGIPSGFLLAGDKVTVSYKGPGDSSATTVFTGEVETRIENQSRGDDATETVTVTGPWSKMARLVFRQWWRTGSSNSSLSSRLILNQADDGTAQSLNVALAEIAWGSNNTGPNAGSTPTMPSGWGYQVGTIDVSTQELPFDPTRDITIAEAIVRELKFFPAAVASFDYSTTPPTLNITLPDLSGNAAAYVATIPKTSRQHVYNAHPITGVDLEIETVGDVDGVEYRNITHQTAGNTLVGNPDCLYATLQLAGFSSSSVRQSFVSEVESLSNWNGIDDPAFWFAKHPYLKNLGQVTQGNLTITNAHRSGSDTTEGITDYPNISKNSVGEITAAGLKARVETFTCTARIVRTGGLNSDLEEVEEGVQLQMEFVTTNATNRTYTWTDSSSSTSGETVPTGLAAALLAARSGALKEERFTMRLGTAAQWPKLGDLCDGLVLQEFDVDLAMLTADLHFGTPDYLSPDDMAALMTGFRNKARSTFSTSRVSGKPEDDASSTVDMGGVMPLSSTEFSPGVMEKTFLTSSETVTPAATRGGTRDATPTPRYGNILIDCTELTSEEIMKVRQLKCGVKILSTGDIQDTGMFAWNANTRTIGPGGVMVGRDFIMATGTGTSDMQDGAYYCKITLGANTVEIYRSQSFSPFLSHDGNVSYIPIYDISNGKVSADYRGAFVVPAYE